MPVADPMHDRSARTTKRGYSANGLARSAVERLVNDEERLHFGTSAHPWPKQLKGAMVDACDGALSTAEIEERIRTLRLGHEQAVFLKERKNRARAKAVATQRLPGAGPRDNGSVFRFFGKRK